MKIYTRCVIDMATSDVLEADWYEHDGPVAECKKGGKKPKTPDPVAVSAAQTQSNQDTAAYNAALNRVSTYTPQGQSVFSQTGTDPSGAPIYRQDVTLSPDAQALYQQQTAQSRELGNVAQNMMGRVDSTLGQPLDTSKLPALNGQIDTKGLPQLFGADDLLGARQQAQDALYNRQAAYLDPQWNQREGLFRSRMANQGVVENSEAWKNALDDENRARSFDYGRAREAAIAGGGSEMGLLSGIASGNRGQMFGERATNAGFGNDARTQGMAELYAQRNLPLNEFNALRSSSQVDMPQFQGASQANAAPTDVSGNYWNAFDANMAKYNAQQAQQNGIMSGMFGLGSSVLSGAGAAGGFGALFSDERLKENVEPIGELPGGTMAYEYNYRGDSPENRHAGVMAQEVEHIPGAVSTHKSGFKMVNYAKVLAKALGDQHGA